MHCRRFLPPPQTRREMLWQSANGFGGVALASLLSMPSYGGLLKDESRNDSPLAPRPPDHKPRAKNIIFLHMDGGPSQVDTFDPKPRLNREHGRAISIQIPEGLREAGKVLKSPWKFQQHGECGTEVSSLFPHVAQCVDDLCVIRSMVTEHFVHAMANMTLHTGHGRTGRPSIGAWATYGLGSECNNLPGFLVLGSGMIPVGGMDCFESGALPRVYGGCVLNSGGIPVANITRSEPTERAQNRKLTLLQKMNRTHRDRTGHIDEVESVIANFELASRMQTAVPDLLEITEETKATQQSYGLNSQWPETRLYGKQCLLARRLVERGVRFIELLCPDVGTSIDRWDQHANLKKGHERNARAVDQPIAALINDLKSRDLLDETLVIWAGEFGRTPISQGPTGRDHNPYGFSIWLAGGGIQGGMVYGATDEYGLHAVENIVDIHDLHATMFHLLGIDQEQLMIRASGTDERLNESIGNVVHDILA